MVSDHRPQPLPQLQAAYRLQACRARRPPVSVRGPEPVPEPEQVPEPEPVPVLVPVPEGTLSYRAAAAPHS
jgi:hypothetical protein